MTEYRENTLLPYGIITTVIQGLKMQRKDIYHCTYRVTRTWSRGRSQVNLVFDLKTIVVIIFEN